MKKKPSELRRNLIIVISGPSGSGKSTIISKLISSPPINATAKFSVSTTTRPPRPGETDGKDYHFVTHKEFEKMKKQNYFVEWAEVHGELYGTPITEIERIIKKGKDIILELDVQGGHSIKKLLPEAVMIFLSVPQEVLRNRLMSRATALTPEQLKKEIQHRLKTAKIENKAAKYYEHIVSNIDLEKTIRDIHCIIKTERRRLSQKP